MTTEVETKSSVQEKQRMAGAISGGIASLVFFYGIAVAVEIIRTTDVSGVVIGAFILIGIGVIVLVKALFFRNLNQHHRHQVVGLP